MVADSAAWCDLCELPRATCVHGMPVSEAAPPPTRTSRSSSGPARAASPRKRTPGGSERRAPADSGPRRPDTRVSVRRTARARTPAGDYRPHIVAVLQEHDGAMDGEELLAQLHDRMADDLLEGDHETVSGGETRWRFAARQERAAMTKDGLLAPPRRPGLWELS